MHTDNYFDCILISLFYAHQNSHPSFHPFNTSFLLSSLCSFVYIFLVLPNQLYILRSLYFVSCHLYSLYPFINPSISHHHFAFIILPPTPYSLHSSSLLLSFGGQQVKELSAAGSSRGNIWLLPSMLHHPAYYYTKPVLPCPHSPSALT